MEPNETITQSPVSIVPRWFAAAFLVLGLIGLTDATYLSIRHFSLMPGTCLIGTGCDNVLASAYSVFAGVPVAFFGVAYYLAIVIFASAALYTKNSRFMLAAAALSVTGLFASAWFVYLQFFILHEICAYCMISATTSLLLFIGGVLTVLKMRKRESGS
ncbi:MAG: vitamin K epoxide reductase family protein [bacterium]|nr:vitamin K epoxide reductase family protein [bacterium]